MEKQLCCGLDTTKAEQYILAHLRPITEYADTYFCHVSKFRADRAMDNLEEKLKRWAEKNGGKFCTVSEKKTIGDEKGYFVNLKYSCVFFDTLKEVSLNTSYVDFLETGCFIFPICVAHNILLNPKSVRLL